MLTYGSIFGEITQFAPYTEPFTTSARDFLIKINENKKSAFYV